LTAELAVLDGADIGEDPEIPKHRERKEWQRSQYTDHSKSEHDEPEDSHADGLLQVR
jgi:hypothetical protein